MEEIDFFKVLKSKIAKMSEREVDEALTKSMKIDAERQMLLDELSGVRSQLSSEITQLSVTLKDVTMVSRLELLKEYKSLVDRVMNNPQYLAISDLINLLEDVQKFLKN